MCYAPNCTIKIISAAYIAASQELDGSRKIVRRWDFFKMRVSLHGLFETHLTVRHLETSVAFYQDTVGLELAYVSHERRVAFFWIGGRGKAMIGIWEVGDAPNGMHLHLAFNTTVEQILAAPSVLKALGVIPRGFHGEPVEEPVVIGWMPALSLYFSDPDGHLLEYLAMLPEEPRPQAGIVSFSGWKEEQLSQHE